MFYGKYIHNKKLFRITSILYFEEDLPSDVHEVRQFGEESDIPNKFSFYETSLSVTWMVRSEWDVEVSVERFLKRPSDKFSWMTVSKKVTFSREMSQVSLIVGTK